MTAVAPVSIFRTMPTALPLKERRLFGAFAYAIEGAHLSFERLRQTAERYAAPAPGSQASNADWTPEMRLSVNTDAWAFVDHVNRVRKLLTRFNFDGTTPQEVEDFLDATDGARQIRNRLQHLDEDIHNGVFSEEGHPVLGTVSWTDGRSPLLKRIFAVASGPSIDAGKMIEFSIDADEPQGVGNFRLMAADQRVNLDQLMDRLEAFVPWFSDRIAISIGETIRAAALEQNRGVEAFCCNGITDMVMLSTFEPKGDESFELKSDGMHGLVEVPPGTYRLPDCDQT